MNENLIFWDGAGRIQPTQLYNFLESQGFGLYYTDENKEKSSAPKIVQVINNKVNEISDSYLMGIVRNYIINVTEAEGNSEPILDSLHKSMSLFSSKNFNLMPKLNLSFIDDDREHIHFFFLNGIVVVTANNIKIVPYEQLEGCVWECNIIKSEISLINLREAHGAEFFQLIRDITSMEREPVFWKQRTLSLCSAIGYMLSRYKNESITKAVILMDEFSSGIANGGTCKTLVVKAIGKLRNLHIIDGKFYDPRRWFKFSGISTATEIVLFDDIQKDFDFEMLYPMMTTGIEVIQKYKDSIYIPYEKSPKIIITTNYAVNGEGSSFNRRVYEFEISRFYNDTIKPEFRFGHLLFTDWDNIEWNRFYNVMFFCSQLFLKKGLIYSDPINIRKTKLINQTSEEFLEFAQDKLTSNSRYDKKWLYDKFIEAYPEYRNLHRSKFLEWLRSWAVYKGCTISETHSNDIRYISFTENPAIPTD